MTVTGEKVLSERERRFLDENPFVGVVTTMRDDGSPHSTVVWVDVLEDGAPSFNTARRRAKERHLNRDPRVSLVVVDPADGARWVAVTGTAELTEAGADAQVDKLVKKYLGTDEQPWRTPDQVRVSVRIRPELIESTGL